MANLMNLFSSTKKPESTNLVKYFYKFALKSKTSAGYVCSVKRTARLLEEFEDEYEYKLTTYSFNDTLSEQFIHFLRKKGFNTNTIRSHASRLSTMLKRAGDDGYKVRFNIRQYIPYEEESLNIYLTVSEIMKLYDLKLSKSDSVIRDLFVIGCFTGLRHGDLIEIDKKNLSQNILNIKTKKTGVKIKIPVHWIVKEIFEKYNYELPPKQSIQFYNLRMKHICKKADITTPVLVEYTKGYEEIKETVPKYELVASHTARRSFATNLYLAGIPITNIMLLTGHKAEEMFFRYIKIQKEENAIELLSHPFFAKQRGV